MGFSIFTMLCSHHDYLTAEHFHYPKGNLLPTKHPDPPAPKQLATTIPLTVSGFACCGHFI